MSQKRGSRLTSSENGSAGLPPSKKVKLENGSLDKVQKVAAFIADFNLMVNELFQLREYSSIAAWNPSDFASYNTQAPEKFSYFVQLNDLTLKWDKEPENLDSLPLRLQKKVLSEREEKLLQKYPFKHDASELSQHIERELLQPVKVERRVKKPKPEPKVKVEVRAESSFTEEPEEPEEDDEELDVSDSDLGIKVKAVKFRIAAPKITHPSHIPAWRPELQTEQMKDDKGTKIIEYDPQPITVISSSDDPLGAPQVDAKIQSFLQNHYKVAIIDDTTNTDYNNSPEEYEQTTAAQESLLRRLYEKIHVEQRFELNGDKIERRKIILPTAKGTDAFRETGSVVPKIQGAINNETHLDHLLTQGMAFSKIHQQMRKQHQLRTRKVAQMVEQHFKKKAGEKERLAREREQNLRRISRIAIQAVKKRWGQAQKVYKYLQQQKEEELKQIQGREHLSQMLEHSTQLLEAQLTNPKSREDTEEVDSDDSENISSDLAEDEPSDKDDMLLSVEELRKKYADLESSVTAASETAQSESEPETEDAGLATLYESDIAQKEEPVEYTEDQKMLINKLAEEANSELDEESDDSLDESESESESDSESEAEKPGLASLFGAAKDDEEEYTSDVDMEAAEEASADEKQEDAEVAEVKPTKEETPLEETEVNGTRVIDVRLPSLLRGTLRPYQKQGLNWLASLYNNNTNGILADEMGLGKTIQTISLLAYLACEHHIWGPHLIVVPTSVMLNWEMEFKKFAPGFKVLTYYGSPQQRAQKRKGWNKPDTFHVCITSYQLVVHDHSSFKRKRWRYMILDEAHNIKNFRSTRWRALLNFNTENRLLLTGTPLQNNLMELWSLLYFLMPSSKVDQAMPQGFANLEDFQQWFGKPVDKIMEQTTTGDTIDEYTTKNMDAETQKTVARLHQVLRPYLLRRLKRDVEKQMPGKYEHIVYCRLSNRQRYLYDDFMSRAKTKETLASGNFLSIINCLMQLRKVCNHPDLFEVRPVVTSFSMPSSVATPYSQVNDVVKRLTVPVVDPTKVSPEVLNLDFVNQENLNIFVSDSLDKLQSTSLFDKQIQEIEDVIAKAGVVNSDPNDIVEYYRGIRAGRQREVRDRLRQAQYLNRWRCLRKPRYGESFLKKLGKLVQPLTVPLEGLVYNLFERATVMGEAIDKFSIITPPVVAVDMKDQLIPVSTQRKVLEEVAEKKILNPFHQAQVKLSIAFPDKSLLQFDCGKLQKLASLLQDLVANGHRALIFTQMTKVLDILEQFLNIHGYRYMRLDGATKIEDRQLLTEKFNRDSRIPVFILSTRSGGLGINLTGADTVIFYDSDWNPAMDKQCQDRCHRIGQSRDVHIYRFVSEYTIESNILRKANQKRQLDNVVIQEGEFTTDYFGKFSVRDLVSGAGIAEELPDKPIAENANIEALAQAEDEDDRAAASAALREVAVDDEDFNEELKSATETPGHTPGPEPIVNDGDDADFDDGIGHVDEYMLRFIADGHYWD